MSRCDVTFGQASRHIVTLPPISHNVDECSTKGTKTLERPVGAALRATEQSAAPGHSLANPQIASNLAPQKSR